MTPVNAIEIESLSKRFDLRRKKARSFLSLQRLGAVRDVLRGHLREEDSRDQLWALRDINIRVRQGEILGIIGRNGAGKSTLLKVLARIIRPTHGQIRIRGEVASLLEMGMGFDRDLTVRENLMIHGVMNNISQSYAKSLVDGIVALAKLDGLLDTPLRLCPGGSYIRLAFATVVNSDADVILADEILAVGDAAFQTECINHIREGSSTGKTVLFVSHDMTAIKELCHRVVWLDKGRIVAQGDPDDVIARYSDGLLGRNEHSDNPARVQPLLTSQEATTDSGVRHVRLISESGAEIGALGMNSEAVLEFVVHLASGIESFRVHMACFHDARIVFAQSQPLFSAALGAGTYRVCLHLPAHFFNEFVYEFKGVLEVVQAGKSQLIESDKALTISIHNTDAECSAWGDWPRGRPGLICPKLDWEWKVLPATK
jgi:lipopolysaccharide transport system ATP-binding protein